MPELTLASRCCDRKLPRYIKHSEIAPMPKNPKGDVMQTNDPMFSRSASSNPEKLSERIDVPVSEALRNDLSMAATATANRAKSNLFEVC